MGRMAQAMYEQAQEDFAKATVNLITEEFQRGTDSLGENGWGEVARWLQDVGATLRDQAHCLSDPRLIENQDNRIALLSMLERAIERAAAGCDATQGEIVAAA